MRNLSLRRIQKIFGDWFIIFSTSIVIVDLLILRSAGWSKSRQLELAIILDFAIIIPMLCALYFRKKPKAAFTRSVGLACLAIWLLGIFVPKEVQVILPELTWVRYGSLFLLAILEAKVFIIFVRSIFSNDIRASHNAVVQANELGMPKWIAKLVALEARFWQRVRTTIRGR